MEANANNNLSDRPPVFQDFNFDKFAYRLPSSFTKAPLSDRSVKKKEKKEKKAKKEKQSSQHQSLASASQILTPAPVSGDIKVSLNHHLHNHGPPDETKHTHTNHKIQHKVEDENPLNSKVSLHLINKTPSDNKAELVKQGTVSRTRGDIGDQLVTMDPNR